MPVQTKYQRLVATYGMGKAHGHQNIFRRYCPDTRVTIFWCETCNWEQRVSDLEAMDGRINWSLPQHCYTYKERWEGKYDAGD